MLDFQTAVEDLDDDKLEDQIAIVAAHIDAASYRLLMLIAEMDRRSRWGEGFVSTAHWLHWRIGVSMATARDRVRVARRLDELPKISEAMRKGEVSYSKVRAMVRVATPATEDDLLNVAEYGTAHHVEKLVRGYRRTIGDSAEREAAAQHESRYLSTHYDAQGMFVIKGRLPPEVGAIVGKALQKARDEIFAKQDANGEGFSSEFQERHADALARIAEDSLAGDGNTSSSAERYQIVVHVDEPVLANEDAVGGCTMDEGPSVSAETIRRIACDASVVTMHHGSDGEILDVGRKTRTIAPAIRRALKYRDGGCCFPGCTHSRYVDGHHIEHWADGGETKLDNLLLLCRYHHRVIHEGAVSVRTQEDGTFVFVTAGGITLDAVPNPPPMPETPTERLAQDQRDAGIEVSEHTIWCKWNGQGMDYDWAIYEMCMKQERADKAA